MMSVLTEIAENRNDPQLKIKLKYLSEENRSLTEENARLHEQLVLLKSELKTLSKSPSPDTTENQWQSLPVLPAATEDMKRLTEQISEQQQRIKQLQYENFVSQQIIDSIKIIESDLKGFYESRVSDLKGRIEGLIEKVREFELLKSIPLGNNGDIRYFLITKNV